jgi:hypothetical protein
MNVSNEAQSPTPYEAPAIESTLDAEKLSRELHYAGIITST